MIRFDDGSIALSDLLPFLSGYWLSLVAGQWAVRLILDTMPLERGAHYSTRLLGYVEAVVYTSAWVLEREAFIPIWLGLKVAGAWGQMRLEEVRPIFNRWLVGLGISLAFGIAGGEFIKKARESEWLAAIGLAVVLIIFTVLVAKAGRYLAPARPFPRGVTPSYPEQPRIPIWRTILAWRRDLTWRRILLLLSGLDPKD